MKSPTYVLPDEAVFAADGDYVLNEDSIGQVKVFRVTALVSPRRLLPIVATSNPNIMLGLVDEMEVAASAPSPICYLVTMFERNFRTFDEAKAGVDTDSLGASIHDVCINVARFSRKNSVVYRRP